MAESIIRITQSAKPIRITSQPAVRLTSPGTSGEANLIANVGGGDANVFRDKIGATLNLRTISGIGAVTVAENGDVIEISSAAAAGDVVGPASSLDNQIARFDALSGKIIQTSLATIDDAGIGSFPGGVTSLRETGGPTVLVVGAVADGETLVRSGSTIVGSSGGAGDVVGPASSVDNELVRFDGITGKLIQAGGGKVTVADDGTPTFNGSGFWQINALRGFGADLRNSSNQVFLLFGSNSGVRLRGNGIDVAAAFGLAVDTQTVLATAGANILELWNGLKDVGTKVFTVDKDGDIFTDSGVLLSAGGLLIQRTDTTAKNVLVVDGSTGDITFGDGVEGTFQVKMGSAAGLRITQTALFFDPNGGADNDYEMGTEFVCRFGHGLVADNQGTAGQTSQFILRTNNNTLTTAFLQYDTDTDTIRLQRGDTVMKDVLSVERLTGDITLGDGVEGFIQLDGQTIGFYGTTPAAQSAAHTPTNVSTDRAYDADATTLSEIADVLGTLIADLQATGLIG